jgi:hypothetical protein
MTAADEHSSHYRPTLEQKSLGNVCAKTLQTILRFRGKWIGHVSKICERHDSNHDEFDKRVILNALLI